MQIEEIETEKIDGPKEDIRGEIDISGLDDLAESIAITGLIQPIVVFKNQDRYEVIVGHRRLLACRIAKMETVPALIKDVRPDDIEIMKLDENIFREDVSPIQIAKYIHRIMGNRGLTVMEVSRHLGKTPQWTNTMLRLLDTDEYTQKAVDYGEISYAAALELQKVDDVNHRDVLTRAAVQGGAHTRVIKGWVQDYRNEKGTTADNGTAAGGIDAAEKEKEYKTRCQLCNRSYKQEDLITIQIDPKCYPIFEEMAKNVRLQLEAKEE